MNNIQISSSYQRYRKNIDFFVKVLFYGFLIFIGILIFLLFGFLFFKGFSGLKLLFSWKWDPVNHVYSMLPFLIGTLTTTLLTILFALPLSIGSALFIYEFCSKKIKKFLNSLIQLLAGIPSVVFGFFGLIVISKFFGLSIFSASIILTFMILPLIVSFINIGLNSIEKEIRDNAFALGCTRINYLFRIALKMVGSSVLVGLIIGIARAVGEAMAVSMVIGNSVNLPDLKHFWDNFLGSHGSTITSIILMDFLEATGSHLKALYALGLVLLILVTILNIISLSIHKNIIEKHE
ncbi:ABC transporter permease subunit [symbiont of Argiope bruennichi]|uniref:PstC family ABC transporter permease n=1 Tax=symbiont of Argiope bruennichi TaxID=2810479 RepID=UPI003DA38A83